VTAGQGVRDRVRNNREVLRRLPLFAELSAPDLDRLCRLARRVEVPAGSVVMEEGSEGDGLYIIVDGELEVSKQEGGRDVVLAVRGPGEFLGEMSLLEQAPRSATVRATRPSELIVIQPGEFHALLAASPAAVAGILRVMAARLRSTESSLMEQEKLASLGTLAAGLAHELNNPAAAIRRAASHMADALDAWRRWSAELGTLTLTEAQTSRLRELEAESARPGPARTDVVACSLEEDRLSEWLEEGGVERAWEVAPPLVAYGWTVERVTGLGDIFGPRQLPPVLHWLAAALNARALAQEMDAGAAAISAIVDAVRKYAYLDQAPVQEVDVRETLETTLLILRHRLKQGVQVQRDYAPDLPRIEAYGSELNQVWTNLIVNALDAMGDSGRLELRAHAVPDQVVVEVVDDGPGIPPDIKPRIFDPFYTTKPPGAGTGLGLHIARNIVVNRHRGRIRVDSRPGQTRVEVSLPVRVDEKREGIAAG
jgi:signal transduction histidine kinase